MASVAATWILVVGLVSARPVLPDASVHVDSDGLVSFFPQRTFCLPPNCPIYQPPKIPEPHVVMELARQIYEHGGELLATIAAVLAGWIVWVKKWWRGKG